MTDEELERSVQRLYAGMAILSGIGFLSFLSVQGVKSALSFSLGAVGSVCNFAAFVGISRAVSPSRRKKSWSTGLFIARYMALLLIGYVIVKSLSVNGLALVFGLSVSAAAVLAASVVEVVQNLRAHRSNH